MTYINILLDKAKEISSSPTDMALAKELGVTISAIANYRHGVSVPKDIVCAKLALLTGESYTKIAASMGEEKAVSKIVHRSSIRANPTLHFVSRGADTGGLRTRARRATIKRIHVWGRGQGLHRRGNPCTPDPIGIR